MGDFKQLALYIAASSTSNQIPTPVLHALDRAISIRKSHNSWHSQTAPVLSQKNNNHAYFVSVLEEVRHILSVARREHVAKSSPQPPQTASGMNNLFQALVIVAEEDEEDDRPAPIRQNSDSIGDEVEITPDVQYRVQATSADEEENFAIWCFLEDINRLLEFVTETWSSIRALNDNDEHSLDFATAAITINTTIDIVRSLEEKLRKICNKDTENIVRIYHEGCCRAANLPIDDKEPGDLINFAAYTAAERSYLSTYAILADYDRYAQANTPAAAPNKDFTDMTVREAFTADKYWLFEALNNLAWVVRYQQASPSDWIPGIDEFTRGARMFMTSKNIPLWFLFAARCHLIAHRVHGEKVARCPAKLNRESWLVASSVRKCIQDRSGLAHPNWEEDQDDILRSQILEPIDAWTVSREEFRTPEFPVSS